MITVRRRSVAILMVALMALTVVSTAGIGAAAPTPQAKYPYINLIYIDRTKVRAGSISIGRGTGQFAIVLNRGLRTNTFYRVIFVNGRNVIIVKAFSSDFHRTLTLYGRLSRADTYYILNHPYGRFELV